jgi:hypothetical protein
VRMAFGVVPRSAAALPIGTPGGSGVGVWSGSMPEWNTLPHGQGQGGG